jgi:Peptidase A4 family
MAVITLEGDVKVRTFRPPPPGFDPLTASAAQLNHHGFPARPDDPHLLERYQRVFSRLKGKFQYIEPTLRIDRNRPPGPRSGPPTLTLTSFNYSGGVVHAPAGQSFRGIQADWVIPNVYPPTQNLDYQCSVWIGLDGFDVSKDRVCQAGVRYEVYTLGNSLTRNVSLFAEWYPDNPLSVTALTVSPGDFVTVALCTTASDPTKPDHIDTARAYFTNNTSGHSTSMEFYPPTHSDIALIGNCAEWIVEAPTNLPGLSNTLPDYGEVFFSSCEAYLVGPAGTVTSTVDGGTGDNLNIIFPYPGGKVISQGTLVTPNIIQCSYVVT